nr:reverse transcriptase domain-containing protein [Tanacetum cinerariifolium]
MNNPPFAILLIATLLFVSSTTATIADSPAPSPLSTFGCDDKCGKSWRHPWDPTLGIALRKMSAMANTTLIVTTVTKAANKEKAPKEADAALKVNIIDLCEEHYEDILPVIIDKIRRDKRKEVHARLDFGETSKKSRRVREGSQNSSARTFPVRGHPHRQDSSPSRDRPRSRDRLCGIEESYGNTCSSYRIGARHRYHSRDKDRSRSMKKGRESKSSLSRMSESGTSDEVQWKSKSKRRKPTGEEDLAVPWSCEEKQHVEEEGLVTRGLLFWELIKAAVLLQSENLSGYQDMAARTVQAEYKTNDVTTDSSYQYSQELAIPRQTATGKESSNLFMAGSLPKTIHFYNSLQSDEDSFELIELMILFTNFLTMGRIEDADAEVTFIDETSNDARNKNNKISNSKRWKMTKKQQKKYVKDPVEIHNIKQRDGETIKDFIERFKPPLPSSEEKLLLLPKRKFTHRGNHRTSQSSTFQSEDLTFEVSKGKDGGLTGKLSHLIKEIKHGRDQPKLGKKEVPAKDKYIAIYMVQPWHRMTRQKVTQSFACVKEITFPPLATSSGTKGSLVIGAEIGGHMIHRMYADGGSSTEALGNNRRCITFDKSMDEFHDRKVIITIQRGIVTIRSTILIPTECAAMTTASKEIIKEAKVCHENFNVALHPNFPDQEIAIGGTLSVKGRIELCYILKENLDIFAWQPSDMTGIPAIQVEVQKLVEAWIMIEVYYHDWLSNPVMIAELDEEKMAFHTSHGVYCYTRMPFSLKNAGATYQRLVDKAFDNQVGRNIEVYIDNLVIKSHTKTEMLGDIDETFHTLRKINMKLNPKKCTFEAVEGMFLGYMIRPEGIKPCPDKTKVALRLLSPQTIKEVQSLNGKLASLNRFLFKSAKKSLPIFKTIKKFIKKSDFHWKPEA